MLLPNSPEAQHMMQKKALEMQAKMQMMQMAFTIYSKDCSNFDLAECKELAKMAFEKAKIFDKVANELLFGRK